MIALRGYDPSFVEDGYFRSFVRSLNPGFEVPSRVAIEEMCDVIFDEAREELFSRLRRAPGRVSGIFINSSSKLSWYLQSMITWLVQYWEPVSIMTFTISFLLLQSLRVGCPWWHMILLTTIFTLN